MSYEALLIDDVTISTPGASGSVDAYNNPIPGTAVVVSEKARIQLKPRNVNEELLSLRDTRFGDYDFFGTKDSAITDLSTVYWGTRKFEVVSVPEVVEGRYGPHHIEASLREVTGA